MPTIDQRVVEMRFDNKQFESGVRNTLNSLNALKEGLKLKNANQGMKDLESTAKNLSLDSVVRGVQSISDKFSSLGVVGFTVLQNLTNAAISAGQRIASALTIEPIKKGFQEYETQINSVQTILANTQSKGTTLDQVSAALDELNHYADKTIYNFTEMTRNIGTFTAAGVDLDTSLSAIKGIANLAAVSGSSSQQASTAMYQLSQALASGTVKLMDWNSVVNAGMGGQVFQDALKETARVHGVAIDEMIDKEGSFRETLQHGWLSSEILTETLSKFTGDLTEEQLKQMGYTEEQIAGIIKMGQTANDAATKVKTVTQLFDTLGEAMQSGWTQSWEIVLGDFEEAKELLTSVSDVLSGMVNSSSNARNAILQQWKDLGGRTALIEALKNSFTGLMSVLKPVKEAFSEVFPAPTGEVLANLSSKLRDLTSGFENMTQTSSRIKATFKGIFTIFQPLTVVAQALMKSFGGLFTSAISAGDGILRLTSLIGSKLSNSIGKIMALDTTVYNIKNVFDALFSILRLGGSIIGVVASAIGALIERLTLDVDVSGGLFDFLQTISRNSFDFTQSVDAMIEKINGFSKSLNESIVNSKGFSSFISGVTGALAGLGSMISNLISGVKELLRGGVGSLSNIFSTIGEVVTNVFGLASSSISEFVQSLEFGNILNVLNTGLIAGILVTIKKFFSGLEEAQKSSGGFGKAIKEVLGGLKDTLEEFQTSIKANSLIKIAVAIGILAGSLAVLASINPERLAAALAGLSVLFLELFGSMTIFSTAMDAKGFGGIFRVTSAMIALSAAVLVLIVAVKSLSGLSWEELARGLGGVGVALAALGVFVSVVDFDKFKARGAIGLIALAAAINLLGVAVEKFANMNFENALKGLSVVGILLAGLGVFVNTTGEASKVITTSTGLLILSVAMNVFAVAVERMGNMSIAQIAKGLVTMAGALAIIAGAMNLMPKSMILTAPALVAIAGSLVILSQALQIMGGMSIGQIGKSLLMLGGSLIIIAAAMKAMTTAIFGAAALLVVASALTVLTPVLLVLGSMSLEQIGMSLLALAGAFAVLGVAGLVLSPVVPTLLGLGVAIGLIGVGCFAAGAGIASFAMGMTALAGAGLLSIESLKTTVLSLIELIPDIFRKIGEGFVQIIQVIAESAGEIAESLSTMLHAIVDKIKEDIPYLAEAGFEILKGLLKGISDNIGEIVIIAGDIIVNFLEGLSVKVPDIIQAGIDLMIAFINGLADGIRNNQERFRLALENLFDAVLTSALEFITGMVSDFIERGRELIRGFLEGIKEKAGEVVDYVKGIPSRCLNAVSGWFNRFFSAGSNMVEGLAAGIRSGASSAINAAANMATSAFESAKAALGINSPSKKFIWIGQGINEGFALGIDKSARLVTKAVNSVSDSAVNSAKRSLNTIPSNMSTTITPVVTSPANLSSLNVTSKLARDISSIEMKYDSSSYGRINTALTSMSRANAEANESLLKAVNDAFRTNNRVVTAINGLRGDVNGISKPSYNINGITYDDGSAMAEAIRTIARAAVIERRV